MENITFYMIASVLATELGIAIPTDYPSHFDNVNEPVDNNLLQLDYLDQAMPATPAAYYEPPLQELEGRISYVKVRPSQEALEGQPYGTSHTSQPDGNSMEDYMKYARLLTDTSSKEDEDNLSYNVSCGNTINTVPDGMEYKNYEKLAHLPEAIHEAMPYSNLLPIDYVQTFELNVEQKAFIDKIQKDKKDLGRVRDRKNPWFCDLKPNMKRKLVSILRIGWGYPNDAEGHTAANNYTRFHIFKDVGELFLKPGTDRNFLNAIIDATRPPYLDKIEQRKKMLKAVLVQWHQFSPGTARKYIREAFQAPFMVDMSDADLVDFFLMRRERSLSSEDRSIRKINSMLLKGN